MLRLASHADIPAALQLCRLAGWNQRQEDWVRLLDYQPDGCFAAEIDSQLVGTVTTTCYGTEMAWIGMMLVHPQYRRRGIATDLMTRSLQYLRDRGVRCIKLDATPEGSFVYRRLGFNEEWSMQRWMREGSGTDLSVSAKEESEHDVSASDISDAWKEGSAPSSNRHHDASVLAPFLDMDQRAFGVDRRKWLERLLPGSQIATRAGALGMLRRGYLASYLGPLIVDDLDDARWVVRDLVHRMIGPIFWDIPDPNLVAVSLARELGFQPVRQLSRMWIGSQQVESDLQTLFALADPSTG